VASELILGIETSCDETSAAVVRGGREVLSNVVASQLVHSDYGGVVPELASREHLRAIVPVLREAMQRARVSYADLDAIAVTEGPGLAGALLVGITFAKAFAFGLGKPLIAVNHLEGHIHAVLMETAGPWTLNPGPFLALVVSGGHTHLYLATRAPDLTWHYRNVGKTLDDAAGEAYDKVAKLLGLPWPGGPWMDALAAHGDPGAVPFRFAQIKKKATGNTAAKLSRENLDHADKTRFDLSFSGIKTAVRRYVELNAMQPSIAARSAALRSAGLHRAKPSEALALVLAALRSADTQSHRQLSGLGDELSHANGLCGRRTLRSQRPHRQRRSCSQHRTSPPHQRRSRAARSCSRLSVHRALHGQRRDDRRSRMAEVPRPRLRSGHAGTDTAASTRLGLHIAPFALFR
jgi:N6-L-threonylcarbamoyladenine synthase